MRSYRIAAMGGDGIGPEVVAAGVEVLKVCAGRDGGFALDFTDFDWGSDYYRRHGVLMPADGAEQLRPSMPSCSGRWARRTSRTTSPCGGCGWRSASRSTSTRMCGRPACCRASPAAAACLGPELDWVIVREEFRGRVFRRGRAGA